MMALGRIVLSIEGLKMDYKQDVQTIIYALQSPPVPVIEGLATASCFDKIITPKTAEPSKSMDEYANGLIGELITGERSETDSLVETYEAAIDGTQFDLFEKENAQNDL